MEFENLTLTQIENQRSNTDSIVTETRIPTLEHRYGSVVCSSGVCGAIVGLDGDSYGQYDHPHFGEWGFFAILSCHLTIVVAIAFCKFRLEWKDREFFVNKKWIQDRWGIDKVKQNPLGAVNIGRFVDSSNNFDMDELMWESLSPSEKAVVKMQTPMLEWNWWCLHFFCCKNMRKVAQKDNELGRMENGQMRMEEFEDSKPRRKSRRFSRRQTIRNRSFRRQKTYDPLGQWGIDWRLIKRRKYIDKGSEGQVFRGTYLSSDVALKEVISATMSDNEDLVDFADEVCLLSRISNHPHIVRFFGITQEQDKEWRKLYAVTELCETSLADYLRRGPRFAGFDSDGDKKFSVDIVRSVVSEREAREYKLASLTHSNTGTYGKGDVECCGTSSYVQSVSQGSETK